MPLTAWFTGLKLLVKVPSSKVKAPTPAAPVLCARAYQVVPPKFQNTAHRAPPRFTGGGGALRFLMVMVTRRMLGLGDENEALTMSRLSMFAPSPAG